MCKESNEICTTRYFQYAHSKTTLGKRGHEEEEEERNRGNKKNATSRRNMSLITTHAYLTKRRESVATALPLEIHWKWYLAGPTLINNINARHGIDE